MTMYIYIPKILIILTIMSILLVLIIRFKNWLRKKGVLKKYLVVIGFKQRKRVRQYKGFLKHGMKVYYLFYRKMQYKDTEIMIVLRCIEQSLIDLRKAFKRKQQYYRSTLIIRKEKRVILKCIEELEILQNYIIKRRLLGMKEIKVLEKMVNIMVSDVEDFTITDKEKALYIDCVLCDRPITIKFDKEKYLDFNSLGIAVIKKLIQKRRKIYAEI